MSDKHTAPNDAHFRAIEEKRHRQHIEARAHARDDGTLTIEQGEAMLQTIRYRRELARLNDALRDAMEQKQEAAK